MRHPQHEGHLQGLLRPQQKCDDISASLDDDKHGAASGRAVLGSPRRAAVGPAAAVGDQRDAPGATAIRARSATPGPVAAAHGRSRGVPAAPSEAVARVPAETAAAQAHQDVRRARGGRQAVFQEDRREPRQAAKRNESQERGAGEQCLIAGLVMVGCSTDHIAGCALQCYSDKNKMKQSPPRIVVCTTL